MKTRILAILFIITFGFCASAEAQKTLIHYWNFDNVVAAHIATATPTIPPISADFSATGLTKGKVSYYLLPGASLTAFDRYIDPVAGTDSNARYSVVPTGSAGNFALRMRNPVDSVELRISAPTTGFTGIVVKYALESSSTASGDSTDVFDYSVDGGTTWKNGKANGMKVNGSNVDTVDTTPAVYQGTSYGVVTIDLSADKTVENNANFIFRIRFRGNASKTSGNNRLDNLTFEGSSGSTGGGGTFGVIHYWNLDNTPTVHLSATTPIPDIKAAYSTIDTNKARVTYYVLPGTTYTFDRYIDPVGGVDTVNARFSLVPTGSAGNFGLRLRNPLDSMETRIYGPTTGYTGIVIKYALQSSSAAHGDSTDLFDYSVDGGLTWKNGASNGMKVNGRANSDTVSTLWNTYQGDIYWGLVTVDLSADKTVENNPNFVFRIRYLGNNNITSGNNRLDNITFEGVGGSGKLPASINVRTPATSAILVAGRQTTISFDTLNSEGASSWTIELSLDGGTTWNPAGTSTTTSFSLTVPPLSSTNAKIRVKDAKGTVGLSAPFIIVTIDLKTNKVIHYWDFNSFSKVLNNPNIPPFQSDFSVNPSTPGVLNYYLRPGTPTNYTGYIDNVAGDVGNAQFGAPAGQALRVRNPVDSVELRFNIPTTGYKNISFGYVLEESSNISPLTRHFDYSTDGGSTWITTGLSITSESNLDSTKFDPTTVTFASGSAAENRANLIFRIKMNGGLISGSSGNNRYDNITVMGDPATNGVADNATTLDYAVYPNPAADHILIVTPSEGSKNITIFDVTGKVIAERKTSDANVLISTSNFASGIYSARIIDTTNNTERTIKFVKQ
jgi:hypothetical protein